MNNESYDFEDRKYVNPTLSRDEQLSFVDNFRNMQQANMNQIVRDTHNLGTDVPSNLGGLSGSEGLWNASYVTPKVNSMISGLRATAQAKALNDVLSNYQEQMKKRYNDAYMAAQKRSSGGDGGGGNNDDDDIEIDYKTPDTATVGNKKVTGSSDPDYENKYLIEYDSDGDGVKDSVLDMSWLDYLPGKNDASEWENNYRNTYYPDSRDAQTLLDNVKRMDTYGY